MKRLLPLLILCAALPAVAGDAAPKCELAKSASLPLSFTGPGQKPTVQGRINGQEVPMLVNTGAQITSLMRDAVEKSGAPMRGTFVKSVGLGGQHQMFMTTLDEFKIGTAKSAKGKFAVMDNIKGGNFPYAAVVGRDFLYQTDMEIDFAGKQINFFTPKNCAESFMAYWDNKASLLPMAAETGGPQSAMIMIDVNGTPMRAIISSGATHSMIDINAAKTAGLSPDKKAGVLRGFGDELIDYAYAPVPKMQIGDEQISNVELAVADLRVNERNENHYDVVLGADFLHSHRILIAASQRHVYISYVGGPAFAARPELKQVK